MFEVPVRTEVQRFQARSGKEFEEPLSAQTDRVPGQAESPAGLQLLSPDRKCVADQAGGGTVPFPTGTPYVGLAAVYHPVRGVGQYRIELALSEQRRRLPGVAGEDGQGNGPFTDRRGSPRRRDVCQ